jgi:hypothetical protein
MLIECTLFLHFITIMKYWINFGMKCTFFHLLIAFIAFIFSHLSSFACSCVRSLIKQHELKWEQTRKNSIKRHKNVIDIKLAVCYALGEFNNNIIAVCNKLFIKWEASTVCGISIISHSLPNHHRQWQAIHCKVEGMCAYWKHFFEATRIDF